MKPKSWICRLGLLIACLRLILAYLDPGSGSLIVQLLIAVIVGILATFRLWKSRLLSLFGRGEKKDQDEDSLESDSQV